MSRLNLPFAAQDVSQLARSLSRELEACDHKPGHVELLNMLARSAGYRNYQHLRAQYSAQDRLERPISAPDPVDHSRVERAIRHFDDERRLVRWPAKASLQILCLWALWSRLPSRRVVSEPQINDILQANHSFGDHALLRRALYDHQLVWRTKDGREYRRLERRPPPEAIALIRHLEARRS